MNTATQERPDKQLDAEPETNKGEVAKPVERSNISLFKEQLDSMKGQVSLVLPPEIDTERFVRIVLTAVQKDPDLLDANRSSLFQSAIEAAADGLLPDGREGAFVTFNTKIKWQGADKWIQKVQWMPMITGITKKVLATGQVKEFRSRVVHEKDLFEVILGDDDQIIHKPHLGRDRGAIIAAYAVLKKHDGGVEREVMIKEDLDDVMSVSKSGNRGPWGKWYSEMSKKSVARRLLKRCIFDEDVQTALSRDDDQYDLDQKPEVPAVPKRDAAKALDDFSGLDETEDADVVEVHDERPPPEEQKAEEDPAPTDDVQAYVDGCHEAMKGFKTVKQLEDWWQAEQPNLAAMNMHEGIRDGLNASVKAIIQKLKKPKAK